MPQFFETIMGSRFFGDHVPDLLKQLKELNKNRSGCKNGICHIEAKPVLKGSVPGLW